jgi:hypothetical protein
MSARTITAGRTVPQRWVMPVVLILLMAGLGLLVPLSQAALVERVHWQPLSRAPGRHWGWREEPQRHPATTLGDPARPGTPESPRGDSELAEPSWTSG